MRSVPTKIAGNTYTSDEFNTLSSQELQNSVLTSGQVLNPSDLNQLGKAMSVYGSAGDFYIDSGTANTYVLTPIGTPARQAPPAYADGIRVRFVAGNTNTGVSTINLNSLGVKNLKENGADVAAGRIKSGSIIEATFISLSDQFELTGVSAVDFIPATNIAELESINTDNLVNNQRVIVGGYFIIGDDGGGEFFLDASSTETANGGTIIIPTFVGFSGTGRWKRIIDDVLTVLMFGASPDLADNTARVQAAIDSLPSFSNIFASDNAGVLFFPTVGPSTTIYKFLGLVDVDAGMEIFGSKAVVLSLEAGTTLFRARDNVTTSPQHIHIHDFTINRAAALPIAGTIGLDMLNVSYLHTENLRMRDWEKAAILGGKSTDSVNGGFYGLHVNNEIANCDFAYFSEFECNSTKFLGGRLLSNKVGIALAGCSDNMISVTFEKTNLGIDFGDGARSNTVMQCRFEASGRGQGGLGATDLLTGGAMHFHANSSDNTVVGGHYSGAGDKIIDEGIRNTCAGSTASAGGVGNNSSYNLFSNPAMDVDSDGNGIIDGMTITASTGVTPSLDTAMKRIGNASQRITIDPTNTIRRDGNIQMAVVPDTTYTLQTLVQTDVDSAWNLRVSVVNGGEFVNIPINITPSTGDGFRLIRISFTPDAATLAGQEFVVINYFMNTPTIGTNANLWIDHLSFNEGVGGAVTSNLMALSMQTNADVRKASARDGTFFYMPEIQSPVFIDSNEDIRTTTLHRVDGIGTTITPASTVTVPSGRRTITVSTPGGATDIDNVTADDGVVVMFLVPSSLVTFKDGTGNMRLAGDFVGGINDILELGCIGTTWFEISRSAN